MFFIFCGFFFLFRVTEMRLLILQVLPTIVPQGDLNLQEVPDRRQGFTGILILKDCLISLYFLVLCALSHTLASYLLLFTLPS